MYRFLLSRRWIGLGLVVIVLAVLFVQLGRWQFHRLVERRADNATIERNLAAPPTPVGQVARVGDDLPEDLEWRRVTARGRFDVAHQLLVRYQIRDGQHGVEVLTPLVSAAGAAVLVDRGWLATTNDASVTPKVPPPPKGQVEVTGWLRADQEGDESALVPRNRQVRLISSRAIAASVPYPLYGGFLQATAVRPAPKTPLKPPEPPEINSGPHFFYGLQWFFFALLAVGGGCYFAWSEARMRRRTAGRRAAAPRMREDAPTG